MYGIANGISSISVSFHRQSSRWKAVFVTATVSPGLFAVTSKTFAMPVATRQWLHNTVTGLHMNARLGPTYFDVTMEK